MFRRLKGGHLKGGHLKMRFCSEIRTRAPLLNSPQTPSRPLGPHPPLLRSPPLGICVKRVPFVKLAFVQQSGAFFGPKKAIFGDFALQK